MTSPKRAMNSCFLNYVQGSKQIETGAKDKYIVQNISRKIKTGSLQLIKKNQINQNAT